MTRVRRKSDINKHSIQRHNADNAHAAKAQIRRNVLELIGADKAHVFDAFAGPGAMCTDVWSKAASYVGCDKVEFQDDRKMFCADSARVMRAIDLQAFNIFDLDSFGSPYEQIIILLARRKIAAGETIGIIITDGTELQMRLNAFPAAVGVLAGLSSAGQVGVNLNGDFIFERILAGIARRANCEIVKRWQATNRANGKGGKTGILMRYVGIVLRGK